MYGIDIWVNSLVSATTSDQGTFFMKIATSALCPETILLISLVGILYFLYKKLWNNALITIFALGGGIGFSMFMKEVFSRARPESILLAETGNSFPSNHAVAATIFLTLLIYFFANKIKAGVWRNIFVTICVLLAILISFSRVYLGVHWVTDVVAGMIFGVVWTGVVIYLVRVKGGISREDSNY